MRNRSVARPFSQEHPNPVVTAVVPSIHSTLAAAPIVELVQKAVQFPAGFQGIKYLQC